LEEVQEIEDNSSSENDNSLEDSDSLGEDEERVNGMGEEFKYKKYSTE
jgi:hypothetical protein